MRPRGATLETEQSRDFVHSLLVFGGEFSSRTQHLVDQAECLFASFDIGRKHRRNCGKRCLLIDQEDIELLAHERLEIRDRHIAVRLPDAASQFKASFIDCGAVHSRVNQTANNGCTQATGRNARFELGDPFLQKLAMQWIFRCFAQMLRRGGIDANRGLERGRAIN